MKDIVKLLEKTLVGGYNDITVYNLKININNKPCIITAEKHNYDMQITSYKWEITEENKDITPEIKNIILFNLIEQEENSDFKRYVNIYKDDLAETRNWIKKYSDKSDINITLEDVGSLESMKAQMIHIVNQNAIMKQEDKDKINDEIFNIIDVEKGLIYTPSNLIFTNEELRKTWEEDLKIDSELNEDLDDLKKKIPFEQWKQNLIDTGEYEETVYFNNDSMFTLQKSIEKNEESEEDEL